MIPLVPKSVKMTEPMFSHLHEKAEKIGYSDNQLIVETINAILTMSDQDAVVYIPKIVVLLRTAQEYEKSPQKWMFANPIPCPPKKTKKSKSSSCEKTAHN